MSTSRLQVCVNLQFNVSFLHIEWSKSCVVYCGEMGCEIELKWTENRGRRKWNEVANNEEKEPSMMEKARGLSWRRKEVLDIIWHVLIYLCVIVLLLPRPPTPHLCRARVTSAAVRTGHQDGICHQRHLLHGIRPSQHATLALPRLSGRRGSDALAQVTLRLYHGDSSSIVGYF